MDIKLMEDLNKLMDGEPTSRSREELVEILITDPEARRLWQRYHLIRKGLKNQLTTEESMVERVRSVINAELAPWEIKEKTDHK